MPIALLMGFRGVIASEVVHYCATRRFDVLGIDNVERPFRGRAAVG